MIDKSVIVAINLYQKYISPKKGYYKSTTDEKKLNEDSKQCCLQWGCTSSGSCF